VGQPDGGRDATRLRFHGLKAGFVMFQVKFVREPGSIDEPHKWLLSIIEQEAAKVKKQIPEGAKQYILLTNVRGTAHPRSGSIDSANKLLTQMLGIPSSCWWRDDLCRRLDNSWDSKWSYPELMTGPDLIRYVIENGLSEAKERRSSALRAFIRYQYSTEEEVKFKQVELQNKLLDLFIDVPIEPRRGVYGYYRRPFLAHKARGIFIEPPDEGVFLASSFLPDAEQPLSGQITADWLAYDTLEDKKRYLYAARYAHRAGFRGSGDLLLQPDFESMFPRVVLEGAPGQGKSTIVQYICQVHRMRLLEIEADIQVLPDSHKTAPLRLPIKADLRDLASWLARRNPFTPEGGEIPQGEWTKSLESFLSALIRYQSGGTQFDVADLHAVAKLSAILLVFDGLDEVADIDRRREVVEEIVKGVDRLEANAASLQVVVTSRPSGFANSPGLPEDRFKYFQLGDLSRELIDQYAEKWLKARRLHGRESAEVKKILKVKLTQPHLRDLARNPMQLAILLSLIHTRGSSLPDKRTALYDSYIELFFNREAEKSPIVRDHRDLLINIHRYLAWLLHSEVELGNESEPGRRSGAIASDRLIRILKEYLRNEGYDPGLANTLFTGMVERVVALVSRIQGTYEFEVQPLREYFAARYLYETAPYSPPGSEKRGTKPDRFDALARNFYWLNVTRFYAGCYSKGELASLIDRIQELAKDADYGLSSHPRILGAILLSDWVFSQHPKSVAEVLNLILDGVGLRFVLSSNSRRVERSTSLALPKSCGNQELVDRCISLLGEQPSLDYALDVIDLLKANISSADILPMWFEGTLSVHSSARTNWLEYGLQLGCLSNVGSAQLEEILSDQPLTSDRIHLLMRAKRFDFLESTEERFSTVVKSILSGDTVVTSSSRIQGTVDLLAHCLDVDRYAIAFKFPRSAPLSATWKHAEPPGISDLHRSNGSVLSFAEAAKCSTLFIVVQEQSERPASEWTSELSPWDIVVEEARRLWGNQWVFHQIANVASGIKSQTETCTDSPDLFDDTKSLCRRSRYARLRAGTASWWTKHFQIARTTMEKLQVSQLWLTWASENTIMQSFQEFSCLVASLESDEWARFFDSVERGITLTQTQSDGRLIELDLQTLPASIPPRACVALGLRSRPETRLKLYRKYLADYNYEDVRVLQFCQNIAVRLLLKGERYWHDALRMISHCFTKGVVSEPFAYVQFIRRAGSNAFPSQFAVDIIKNANQYPGFLVAAAESKCRENLAKKIVPVGQVAERDRWFE
jgi:hypothetical protein